MKPLAWRTYVALAGTMLLALFAFLNRERPDLYFTVMGWWNQETFWTPFLDLHFILSAIDCRHLGFDPFIADPCDLLDRPYNYSPLFLEAGRLGLTSHATDWIGIGLGLVMVGSQACLPAPRGFREATITAFAYVSLITALVIERGNIDIVIFALTVAISYLAARGSAARWFAYLLVVLAACLKFYPIVLLVLVIHEKPRRLIAVGAVAAALFALYLAVYGADLVEAWNATPPRMSSQQLWGFFGAINLPSGIESMLTPILASYSAPAWIFRVLRWMLLAPLALAVCHRAVVAARSADGRARLFALPTQPMLLLIAGAALIVACFFSGQSTEYRGIFLILTLPGLYMLGWAEGGTARYRFAAIAAPILMWRNFFSKAAMALVLPSGLPGALKVVILASVWLWLELVWWLVIVTLLGILLAFLAESPIGKMFAERFGALRYIGAPETS